jgi:hypothetical protein
LEYGFLWSEGLKIGLQTRIVERKFIHEEFSALDAAADFDSVLKVKEQKALFLEPGLSYEWESDWKPQVSALISNVGFVSEKYNEAAAHPVFDFGFGIAPPLEFGNLGLAVSYRKTGENLKDEDAFRFGGVFELGVITTSLGYGPRDLAVGVNSGFGVLGVGFLYRQTQIESFDGRDLRDHAVFTELSLEL